MAEFVESIRYEADITDLKDKMRRIESSHDDLDGKTSLTTGRMRVAWDKLTSGIGSTVATLGKVGLGLATAGVALAATFGPRVLEQGVALDALGKKAATVFEGSLGGMQDWATKNAAAMGLTRTQLIGMAADTADLLKPMGFAADEAAKMSASTTELAGALSAWTGGKVSSADASAILTKAYLGERDALTSLGIKISEEDVKARLAAKGQAELTGQALEQAKAMATMELIFAKSTDAQTAWSNGSMDAVKALNASKASTAQLKESLVKALYPAVTAMMPVLAALTGWLAERLPGAVEVVSAWFREHWPTIKAAVGDFVAWFQSDAMPVIEQLFDRFLALAGAVVGWVVEHWPEISATIGAVVGWLVTDALPVIETVMAAIIATIGAVVGWVVEHWPEISATIGAVVDWVSVNVLPVVAAIAAFIVTEFGNLKVWVDENWPKIRETITNVIEAVSVVISTTVAIIKTVWKVWGDELVTIVTTAWNTIKAVVAAAIDVVRGVIDTVTAIITGDWSGAWEGIKTIFAGVWQAMSAIVSGTLDTMKALISGTWDSVAATFAGVWDGIKSGLAGVWDGIKSTVSDGVAAIVDSVGGLGSAITAKVSGAFDGIWSAFKGAVNRVIDAWNSLRLPGFTIGGWDPPGPGSFPAITIPSIGVPPISRLAAGGLAFGPMLAVVGDNPRAAADPEVISPVSKMADTFRGVLDEWAKTLTPRSPMPNTLTLVIEGRPFTAILDDRDDYNRGAR